MKMTCSILRNYNKALWSFSSLNNLKGKWDSHNLRVRDNRLLGQLNHSQNRLRKRNRVSLFVHLQSLMSFLNNTPTRSKKGCFRWTLWGGPQLNYTLTSKYKSHEPTQTTLHLPTETTSDQEIVIRRIWTKLTIISESTPKLETSRKGIGSMLRTRKAKDSSDLSMSLSTRKEVRCLRVANKEKFPMNNSCQLLKYDLWFFINLFRTIAVQPPFL